jgi:hypothetical protein
MNIPRILRLLLPALLLAPVVGVVDSASALTSTAITINGQPRVGIFHDEIGPKTGDVFRHKGKLTTAEGDPIDGATVYLERMLTGDDDWVRFTGKDVVTNAKGVYVFFTYVERNGQYRVVYEGDPVYAPVTSDVLRHKAMRDFNPQLVEKQHTAILKGRINPDWDNKQVVWQKRTCKTCAWKQIAKDKTGDNGSWSFPGAYPPLHKKWYYRAVVDGDADFGKSYSATLITTSTVARTVR